uniref:Uncharacterized protein n=1 Tax=Ciona intestinalis TaxID=7719 RepID=H2XMK4_CIOIN
IPQKHEQLKLLQGFYYLINLSCVCFNLPASFGVFGVEIIIVIIGSSRV